MTVSIPTGAPAAPDVVGRPNRLMAAGGYTLRAPRPGDQEAWRDLYRQVAEHYTVPADADHQDLVWSWVMDADHPLRCLLAEAPDGTLHGLAHYRPFTRPLAGSVGCFLDDLLVDEEIRGTGAADALLHGLRQIAAREGWTVVRWITADDNHRARGVYDEFAVRTMWVTYDMTPGELPVEMEGKLR
ncbi:MAG: GNAT family N-acetyltransferase [Actinomycetota bacterium]|nr:GNAT family N-acetyltransferase [Actinomycetota bacterium]